MLLSILSPGYDDQRAMTRVADGDTRALHLLYERYASRVFATAKRLLGTVGEAEEVVQETFIDVWVRAGSFDRDRGAVASWILGIGHNRAIDRLRSRATIRRTVAGAALEPQPPSLEPEGQLARAQNARLVAQALDVLPPELRTVVELAYFQGLSQSEIAERTGHPIGTIKGRARTALKQLAERLSKELA